MYRQQFAIIQPPLAIFAAAGALLCSIGDFRDPQPLWPTRRIIRRVDPPVHMSACASVDNDDSLVRGLARQHRAAPEVEPSRKFVNVHDPANVRAGVRQLKPRAHQALPPTQFRHQTLAARLCRLKNGEPGQSADSKQPSNVPMDHLGVRVEFPRSSEMPAQSTLDFAALPDIERDAVERTLLKLQAGLTRIEKSIDDVGRAFRLVPRLALQGLDALFDVDGIEGHVDLLH